MIGFIQLDKHQGNLWKIRNIRNKTCFFSFLFLGLLENFCLSLMLNLYLDCKEFIVIIGEGDFLGLNLISIGIHENFLNELTTWESNPLLLDAIGNIPDYSLPQITDWR